MDRLATQKRLLNFVANQPEVRKGIAPGYRDVDLSTFCDSSHNVLVGDEHGLVMFAYVGDGQFEGHYLLTDSRRGRDGLLLVKKAIRQLFTNHAASAITGATPRDNYGARAMNRALGFHPVGDCTDTMGRACIKYKLERELWVRLSAA